MKGAEMDQATYDKGMKIRREVLGSDYVDNSSSSADALTKPLQDLVTEYCWGAVWGRPGLDRRTRSFLHLAMISALNRPPALELHVGGALNNGQIGRAPCRERVCQYVSITVVGGSVQKN